MPKLTIGVRPAKVVLSDAQNATSGPLAGSEGDERLAKGDVWVRAYRAGYRAAQDALGVRIEGDSLTPAGRGQA